MTLGLPRLARRTAVVAIAAAALLVAAAPASAKVTYGFAPQVDIPSAGDYELMKSVKTTMVRQGLSWPGVQPAAGDCTPRQGDACDWTNPDRVVGSAAASGLETMLGIYGSASFVNNDQTKPPVNDIPAWEDFIEAAVERYGTGGTYWEGPYQEQFGAGAPIKPVKVWQVWNEQSSFQFFQPKPNVKKYAKILVPASKAIQGADKKATVLLGGMFPDTGPKGIKIEKFLADLYKEKKVKENTFDGVSVHPYAKDGKELDKQLKTTRKAMDKNGGKKDEIWVTEIGYASGGPKGQPVVKKGEKGQAKAITDAYKTLNKKDKKYDIKGVIYFTWQDFPASTGVCKFCVFAGLLDQQGKQKKAFAAYKKAVK
jgi:hypothetical protein